MSLILASSAPIPGTAVKIVNTGTRQEWSMQANDAGVYSISTVPAGQYDITVMVTGYTGLAITAGAILTLFVSMQATAKVNWGERFRSTYGLESKPPV